MSSLKLFLEYDALPEEWKVLDSDNICYGCGDCPKEAIESARVVTNAPIYANNDFKGLISDEPTLNIRYVDELTDNHTLFGADEIMEAMAELGGFNVYKVYDNSHYLMGYTFEVKE